MTQRRIVTKRFLIAPWMLLVFMTPAAKELIKTLILRDKDVSQPDNKILESLSSDIEYIDSLNRSDTGRLLKCYYALITRQGSCLRLNCTFACVVTYAKGTDIVSPSAVIYVWSS